MQERRFTTPPKEIFTDRLKLVRPTVSQSNDILKAYAGDPQATKYLSWPTKNSLKEAEDFVKRTLISWDAGNSFTWLVLKQDSSSIIGCFAFRPARTGYEIGYVIGPDYWGKGFGTELVKKMILVGFEDPAVERVWAYCDTENLASIKLLEKCGMEKEGCLKKWGESPNLGKGPRDQFVYAVVR